MFIFAVMHDGGRRNEVAKQSNNLSSRSLAYSTSYSNASMEDSADGKVREPQHLPLPKRYPPVGFKNWGNTCYANAALQCLMSTALSRALLEPKCFRIFKRYSSNYALLANGNVGAVNSMEQDPVIGKRLEYEVRSCDDYYSDNSTMNHEEKSKDASSEETCKWLTDQLTTLCKEYTANPELNSNLFIKIGLSEHVIDPGSITRHVTRLSECLRIGRQEDAHEFLRALLSTLIMDGKNRQLSSLFDGLLESGVTCQTCGYTSLTRDRYMDLSLEISSSSTRTLRDALAAFTKTELLSLDNKVDCSRCGLRCQVSKGLKLATAPTILVFHLKRFMQDKYGRISRLSKAIEFPLVLDIKDFMSKVNRSTPPLYELVGVLVHQGQTCSSGHYLSYVRSGNSWYRASDNHVVQVSIEHVLQQKAYILMYEVKGMRNHKIPCSAKRLNSLQRLSTSNALTVLDSGDISGPNNHQQQIERPSTLLDPCALFSFLEVMPPICTNSCFGGVGSYYGTEIDGLNRCVQYNKQVDATTTSKEPIENNEIKKHKRSNSTANLLEVFQCPKDSTTSSRRIEDIGPFDVPRRRHHHHRRSRSLSRTRSAVSRSNFPVMTCNGNSTSPWKRRSASNERRSHRNYNYSHRRDALPPRPERVGRLA